MAAARGAAAQRSRLVAALIIASVALCTACSAGGPTRARHDPPTSADDDPNLTLCLARQKGGFAQVHSAVQRLTQVALLHPDEVPASAIRRAQGLVTGLPDERDPPCSEPLTPLRDALRALEPGRLDENALKRVIAEVHRWRSALGREHPGPIVYEPARGHRDLSHEALCALVRKHARVTYQVRYRDRPSGRVGWTTVRLTNSWDRWLGIGHGGWLHVRDHRGGPVTRRVQWGGSSYDYFWVDAGRTGRSHRDIRLHLAPQGTITPVGVSAELSTAHIPGYCDIPARPAQRPAVAVGKDTR